MAAYADLGPCPYVNYLQAPPRLVAVGWLGAGRRFPRGDAPAGLADLLAGWMEVLPPVEPGELLRLRGGVSIFLGSHRCELLPCWKQRDEDPPPAGAEDTGELFVPHLMEPGAYWVAPRMVVHYLRAHRYSPPPGFVAAVLAAADPARRPQFSLRRGSLVLLLPPGAG